MYEISLKILAQFRLSVNKKKVDYNEMFKLKESVSEMENEGETLLDVCRMCSHYVLKPLVMSQSPLLLYNWLSFFYDVCGSVISSSNLRIFLNQLMMVHRILFHMDEMTQELAFSLWEKVVEIVVKLPWTNEPLQEEKLSILMSPLYSNCVGDSKVLISARLKCWWKLIHVNRDQICSLFEKIVGPLLWASLCTGCCCWKKPRAKLSETPKDSTVTQIMDKDSEWCPVLDLMPHLENSNPDPFSSPKLIAQKEDKDWGAVPTISACEEICPPVDSSRAQRVAFIILLKFLGLNPIKNSKYTVYAPWPPLETDSTMNMIKTHSVILLSACHHAIILLQKSGKSSEDVANMIIRLLMVSLYFHNQNLYPKSRSDAALEKLSVKNCVLLCFVKWVQLGLLQPNVLSVVLTHFGKAKHFLSLPLPAHNSSHTTSLASTLFNLLKNQDGMEECSEMLQPIVSEKLKDIWTPFPVVAAPIVSAAPLPQTKSVTTTPVKKKANLAKRSASNALMFRPQFKNLNNKKIKLLHRMSADKVKVAPPEMKRAQVRRRIEMQLKGNTEDIVVRLKPLEAKKKLKFYYDRLGYLEGLQRKPEVQTDLEKGEMELALQL